MAAMWLIVAMLCFIIKIIQPSAWWAVVMGCLTGLMGIIYFLASILYKECEWEEIDDDDGTKFDGGEEDE
jgi:hypothetical protein